MPPAWDPRDPEPEDDTPRLALRRHTDRCFHPVEEIVPGGYIVEGILIAAEDVAELRPLAEEPSCAPLPPRPRPRR